MRWLVVLFAAVLMIAGVAAARSGHHHDAGGPPDLVAFEAMFEGVEQDALIAVTDAVARAEGIDPDRHLHTVSQRFSNKVLATLRGRHSPEQIMRFADDGAPLLRWRVTYYRPYESVTELERLRVTVDQRGRVFGVDRRRFRPNALRAPNPTGWRDGARQHVATATGFESSRLVEVPLARLVGTPLAKRDVAWRVEGLELGGFSVVIGAREHDARIDFSTFVIELDAERSLRWGMPVWIVAALALGLGIYLGIGWRGDDGAVDDNADRAALAGYGIAVALALGQSYLMLSDPEGFQPEAAAGFVGAAAILAGWGVLHARARRSGPPVPASPVVSWSLVVLVAAAFIVAAQACGGPFARGCCDACGALRCSIAPLVVALVALGRRHPRYLGYATIVGAVTLTPHCVCTNFVNHAWMVVFGDSPMCFFLFFGALLLAVTGLRGVYPRLALGVGTVATVLTLAVGLGHGLFGFPW